ncbi:MAG: TRAP transporter substrate-binding protein DctP [Desulfarculaceae bacterium]|jgi:TRAP-type mannitol/chloroaromatic compound transport system substrate-binding protein
MMAKTRVPTGFMALIVVLTGVFLLTALAMTEVKAADKPIKWKAQCVYGSGLQFYKSAAYFADLVKKMSKGRMVIQMNTGGSIVPAFSEQEAVHKGVLDLSCSTSMYVKGKFPAAVLIGASFGMFKPMEFMAWCEKGGGYKLWEEMYTQKGYKVKVLPPFAVYGSESLGWFRKPIKSLADFKGLKYRTVGEWGEVLTRLGASVMTLPSGELYTALERGVLDATEMSVPSFDKGLGLFEICKYLVFPGVHQTSGPFETLANQDKWKKLPDDLKLIVQTSLRQAALKSMTDWQLEDAAAVEFFKSKGVKIIRLSQAEVDKIKKLGQQVFDQRAAKDPFYAKVLKSQRQFYKSWKAYEELQTW